MYPERAVLYMALGEAQWISTYEEGTYDFWVSLNHVYNLDMSLLADHAVARYKGISFVLLHSKFVVQIFYLMIFSMDWKPSIFTTTLLCRCCSRSYGGSGRCA